MWVDFHKILAKHLYAFNMFLLVRIRLILTVVKFVCDVWMMACIKQLIWYTKNKNIVYVMLLSLHYLKSFHLFSRKPLNFKNTKTNFVRSSTNAGKTQQSYMACCNRWGKEENIQNNRVRERNVKFFSRCMKMPALEWYECVIFHSTNVDQIYSK